MGVQPGHLGELGEDVKRNEFGERRVGGKYHQESVYGYVISITHPGREVR